jgi:toxin ParE1/3/4
VAARLKLYWTPTAIRHLNAAYDYVAKDSSSAADATVERIFSATEMLDRYPQIGRDGRVNGAKELIIAGTPWLVAYRLRGDSIDVLAVLHGARRWPDNL